MNKITEMMLRRKNLIMPGEIQDATIDLAAVTIQDKEGILNSELVSDKTKKEYLALTLCKNIESLGFIPNKALYEAMAEDVNLTAKIAQYTVPELEALKGADVKYNPMYKNFPKEVMEMSEFDLYMNAIIHYWSGGTLYPQSLEEDRPKLDEKVKLIELGIGTKEDVQDLFCNLLNSNTVWSSQDIDDIKVLTDVLDVKTAMPEYIVNHENMATLAKMLVEKDGTKALLDMKNSIKGATDVLRVMNVIHGNGDATLKDGKIKIKNMGRADRKIYLELLNGCRNASKDMCQYLEQWTKIEKVLHPHDYKDNKKFSRALKAFEKMRDEKSIYAEREEAINSGDMKQIEAFYRKKPGMLAGDLDRLLRDSDANKLTLNNRLDIIELYKDIAKDSSTKVLWEVHKHFSNRGKEKSVLGDNLVTSFFKDGTMKNVMRPDTRGEIHSTLCDNIVKVTEEALIELYKDKPAMGKVYIDPAMEKINIPNETRTASKGVVPMTTGSRIPMNENAELVRGFIWWTNQEKGKDTGWDEGRVDIDLSASILDKDLNVVSSVYYGNFGGERNYSQFSGDITNGGNFDGAGVAEFMDIDMKAAKEKNGKYICFNVHSYTGQNFCDLGGHCSFGFMEREKELEGQVFEPSTVKQKINLSQKSVVSTPCLFDVDSKEMIWVDAPGQIQNRACSNEINTMSGALLQCAKAIDGDFTNVADVVRINALARGEIIENKEDADISFGFEGDVRPTDIDYFSGNLLPKEVAPEYEVKEVEEEIKENITEENEEIL